MAGKFDAFFTPGWTTSRPGDMKSGGGLVTKFDRPEPPKTLLRPAVTVPLQPAANHDKPTTDIDAW